MAELEDPQRVGFGLRFIGTVIDVILVTGLSIAIGIFGGGFLGRLLGGAAQGSEAGSLGLAVGGLLGFFGGILLVMPMLGTLYYLVEALTGGTLGKLVLGQRIANIDGTKAGVGTLLDRYVIKNVGWLLWLSGALLGFQILSAAAGAAAFVVFLGCFMALGSARMALHDRVAGTAVFKRADVRPVEAEDVDSRSHYGLLVLVLLVAGGGAASFGKFDKAITGRDRTPVATAVVPSAPAPVATEVVSSAPVPDATTVVPSAPIPDATAVIQSAPPLTPEAAKAAEAHAQLGIKFYNEGKYADVIREYDDAIKSDPGNEEYYYMRGTAHERTGNHASAIADLTKTVATMPEHLNAWDWLGRANFSLGKHDEAIASFDKALAGNSQSAPAFFAGVYFNRATAYYHKGNKERARADYEQSCRLGYQEGCARFDIMNRKK